MSAVRVWERERGSAQLQSHLHSVGYHQQVHIVKKVDLWHLHDEDVENLNEEHEEELPDAAHLQEYRARQQAEQYTWREILKKQKGVEKHKHASLV